MYDLILCVIATTKNNRLPIFQKIGYTKSKYKTKIVYLVDSDDRPDYIDEDCWFNCYGGVGHSFTCRFVEYLKNTYDEAKWFMQVDDDSCTDLDKTIELLNYSYDYEDPVVLTGSFLFQLNLPRYADRTIDTSPCFTNNLDQKLQKILLDMNTENLFVGTDDLNKYEVMPYVARGWEQSVFSCGALNKIKKYDRLQEYVLNCAKIDPEFSDQVPFVLAKLAKIPISQCFFITPTPSVEEYTAINKNGRFSHVHHICETWDQMKIFENIVEEKRVFESARDIEEYFDSYKENSEWLFFHIVDNTIKSRCLLKFVDNKQIEVMDIKFIGLVSYSSVPETPINLNESGYEFQKKQWEFDSKTNSFVITNQANQKIFFSKIRDKLYGFKTNENEVFILSKTHPLDSVFWHKSLFVGTSFARIN